MKRALLIAVLFGLTACKSNDITVTASSTGEQVYQASCATCHEGGLKGWMTSAPKRGDQEAWKPRLAKGLEGMTAITISGAEKMPAKGGCDNCSDEQIKAAVEFMVAQSQ